MRHPINSQKESVGGPGLSGLQSNFISQLCKLLTGEAQPRLALDGRGRHRLASSGPHFVHLFLFPQSLPAAGALPLGRTEVSKGQAVALSLSLPGSSGCPAASRRFLEVFRDVSFRVSSPGLRGCSLGSLQ